MSLNLIVRRIVAVEHFISSLGTPFRLNRAGIFHLWQEAKSSRSVGLRPRVDDLSVFRLKYYSACCLRSCTCCRAIFLQIVSLPMYCPAGKNAFSQICQVRSHGCA